MKVLMKKYDTLYSRDSKGKIRTWYQERDGDKYRTVAGLQDGEKVTSEWTIAKPKNTGRTNATTGEEQADMEVVAKYTKQLKTGYTDNIKNVDNALSYVEPMLANKYKDRVKKIDFPTQNWGFQCKFNGNRCVATKNGLFTRKGEKYIAIPHIQKSLEKFFIKYPDAVLDGELFNNDLRQQLNELSKLVRKTVHIDDNDYKRSEELVKFYVYDGYNFTDDTDSSAKYSERKKWIDTNVVGKYDYIEKVETYTIKSTKDLDKHYADFLADGQEGGILRNLDGSYENKRSNNLLKVKSEEDDEAVILEITDGDGNWKGAATNVTLDWNGKIFDAVFKGNYDTRAKILKEKKNWIGKEVTFLYMGLTGLGTPNYARVDPDNCFKTDK